MCDPLWGKDVYNFKCPKCDHEWKYSIDEALEKHSEMLNEKKETSMTKACVWIAIIVFISLVGCMQLWYFSNYYANAAWWSWMLTFIGELLLSLGVWIFVMVQISKK